MKCPKCSSRDKDNQESIGQSICANCEMSQGVAGAYVQAAGVLIANSSLPHKGKLVVGKFEELSQLPAARDDPDWSYVLTVLDEFEVSQLKDFLFPPLKNSDEAASLTFPLYFHSALNFNEPVLFVGLNKLHRKFWFVCLFIDLF